METQSNNFQLVSHTHIEINFKTNFNKNNKYPF